MRSVAFCLCPAGRRKTAILNQETSRKFFLRTPDLHDIIGGRHLNWIDRDPTFDPNEPVDIESLPARGAEARQGHSDSKDIPRAGSSQAGR